MKSFGKEEILHNKQRLFPENIKKLFLVMEELWSLLYGK